MVTGVQNGSPAEAAGLQSPNPRSTRQIDGANVPTEVDIITAIDGTPITGIQSLIAYLAGETEPGQTVTLTVLRNGTNELQLPVTLAERASGQ